MDPVLEDLEFGAAVRRNEQTQPTGAVRIDTVEQGFDHREVDVDVEVVGR